MPLFDPPTADQLREVVSDPSALAQLGAAADPLRVPLVAGEVAGSELGDSRNRFDNARDFGSGSEFVADRADDLPQSVPWRLLAGVGVVLAGVVALGQLFNINVG